LEQTISQPLTDVARALAETTRTMSTRRTLDEMLDAIVLCAQVSVPSFDQVGISFARGVGEMLTQAATGELVWYLDALQNELGEGPCLDALSKEPMVTAEHLGDDDRWTQYAPQARDKGVRSQLAYRLYDFEHTLGVLNPYSTESDTIQDGAREIGELFAMHATTALGRAMDDDSLSLALTTRGTISQAVGLTMARHQVNSSRALQFLIQASSTSSIRLRDIAEEVVGHAEAEYGSPTDVLQ
jgi:hypothetical protein